MIKFTVAGIPQAQGSMRAFVVKGRAIITSDNKKLKKWRKLVRDEAIAAMGWEKPASKNVPIRVEAVFFLPRAKSNKSMDAVKRPDLDKLLRSLCDSLTGVLYYDDSQIIEAHVFKAYGNPRVEIRVEEAGLLAELRQSAMLKDSEIPF